MAKNGLMIQDDKGNLYFLRPEILEAAKLDKSLHENAKVALKAAKKTTTAPKLKVLGALRLVEPPEGTTDATAAAPAKAAAVRGTALMRRIKTPTTSTIMCPW